MQVLEEHKYLFYEWLISTKVYTRWIGEEEIASIKGYLLSKSKGDDGLIPLNLRKRIKQMLSLWPIFQVRKIVYVCWIVQEKKMLLT